MKVEKKLKMLKETLSDLSESVETLVESSNTLSEAVDDFNDILEALIEEVEVKNKKDISDEEADKVIGEIAEMVFGKHLDVFTKGNDVFVAIPSCEEPCKATPCCEEEKEGVALCLKEGSLYTFYPYKSTFTLSKAELLEMLSFEDEEAEFIL